MTSRQCDDPNAQSVLVLNICLFGQSVCCSLLVLVLVSERSLSAGPSWQWLLAGGWLCQGGPSC